MKLYLCIALALLLSATGSRAQPCNMQGIPRVLTDGIWGYTEYHERTRIYDTLFQQVFAAAGIPTGIGDTTTESGIRLAELESKDFLTSVSAKDTIPKPVILYHRYYIQYILELSGGNPGAMKTIIAHELGHVYLSHFFYNTDREQEVDNHKREYEADKYAGYLARMMNIDVCEVIRALYITASPESTHTHPARAGRVDSMLAGYKYAMKHIFQDSSYLYWPQHLYDKIQVGNSLSQTGTQGSANEIITNRALTTKRSEEEESPANSK